MWYRRTARADPYRLSKSYDQVVHELAEAKRNADAEEARRPDGLYWRDLDDYYGCLRRIQVFYTAYNALKRDCDELPKFSKLGKKDSIDAVGDILRIKELKLASHQARVESFLPLRGAIIEYDCALILCRTTEKEVEIYRTLLVDIKSLRARLGRTSPEFISASRAVKLVQPLIDERDRRRRQLVERFSDLELESLALHQLPKLHLPPQDHSEWLSTVSNCTTPRFEPVSRGSSRQTGTDKIRFKVVSSGGQFSV